LLSPAEAEELLSRRLGAERVAAEPTAVKQIIDACAHLPLALSSASARAAVSIGPNLRALVVYLLVFQHVPSSGASS